MKIAILGAGAIGSLFGALLWELGEDVVLIGRKRHVDAIKSRGLKVSGISGERIVKPKAVTTTQEVGKVDLIIISVKSYDTEQAAKNALNMIHHNTVVLTIQNGLGNIEKLCEIIGEKHVVGGVTMQGSTLVKPGEIYHAGKGPTIIGELNREITSRIKRIAETFNKAKIETQITQNIWGSTMGQTYHKRWNKRFNSNNPYEKRRTTQNTRNQKHNDRSRKRSSKRSKSPKHQTRNQRPCKEGY